MACNGRRGRRDWSTLAPGAWGCVLLCAVWLGVLMGTSVAQTPAAPTGELVVFAAASLTEPFNEIGRRLESLYPGLRVLYNFGGSPILRMQLEQGAQADVFVSADLAQLQVAQSSHVVQGEAPVFVRNRLVVIVPRDNPKQLRSFQDLASPGLKLSLAAPKVPVGSYSRQALSKAQADYGADFAARVLRNLASEEDNVKQVVTKVQLGEADAGIVYASDVTPRVSHDVRMLPIAEAYNQLATYPIALTAGVKNRQAADVFIAFVLAPEGQAILQSHHFLPVRD
ncbi:MAG: molybdate ABC transporter substrate-binding protein [Candidatus Tectimicrobiota bacterium]